MADLKQLCASLLADHSLLVASNRGPVEHHMTPEGRPEPRRGSGSVVTALNSLTQLGEFTWVSSAMGEGDRLASNNGRGPRIKSPLPGQKVSVRYVVTPRRVYHKYYNILCNPLLWFLQHYMWNPPYNPNVDASVHDAWQSGYLPVNQAFGRAVIEELQEEQRPPIVICHDYHLYLLPQYIRQAMPQAIIEHFIHIPWPSPRYWQMIPTYITREICAALCHTNILGFQTPQDTRSFLGTVEQILPEAEVNWTESQVCWQDQRTQVKAYPISINVEEVRRIANSPRAVEHENRLRAQRREATIVRVDRAEPNKNIIRGFRAYELLLSRYPEWQEKVTFWAFLVPSRTHIRQYQRYMDEISQVVEQINAAFGNRDWTPIQIFLENNYTQAIAGMKMYDVMLANGIIEGMNLVVKEGAVVNTCDGVIAMSQSCGGYHQLAAGVLPLSPVDMEGAAETLYQAITMTPEERKRRAIYLAQRVCEEDVNHWLSSQLEDIARLV